jgi:hypothetical protein
MGPGMGFHPFAGFPIRRGTAVKGGTTRCRDREL